MHHPPSTDLATARDWDSASPVLVTGRPLRAIPFVVGYEPIPMSLSVEGGDPYHFILEPVTATAVVYAEGWFLLDSGFNVDTVRDPISRAAHYNFESYTAIVPPGDPLKDAVKAAGLGWETLAGCAISHVHCDHTGGLRLLENGPPIYFQRAEWVFATTGAGLADAVFTDDFVRVGLDIVLLDGDTEIAPGLTAIDTKGHTPGHQSFIVELPEQTIVLACDAADLRENVTAPCACGTTTAPSLVTDARVSARRLHDLDAQPGVEVWPGHDPEWWAWKSGPTRP